jgi:hypothetical protein
MKMKEDAGAEIPWPSLHPWVPSWRPPKRAHSPGSDIGRYCAPEFPLHAVSLDCVWPARSPSCPLQSHLHSTPQILGDPLGRNGPPPTSGTPFPGWEKGSAICISMNTELRGQLRRGTGAAPQGWLLGSAPRRSRRAAPAPPPPAPAPSLPPLPFSARL